MARSVKTTARFNLRKKHRAARDLSAFNELVVSPADLGAADASESLAALQLPANAELAFSCDAGMVAGEASVSIGTSIIELPALDPDQVFRLGFGERGFEVTVSRSDGADPGNVTLYVLDGFREPDTIATGVFS